MQIRPAGQIGQTQGVSFQELRSAQSVQQPVQAPVDRVEISFEAQMLARTSNDGIRTDRVANIRAQIASGIYETPAKLEAAVSRLLDEMV